MREPRGKMGEREGGMGRWVGGWLNEGTEGGGEERRAREQRVCKSERGREREGGSAREGGRAGGRGRE